MKRIVVLGSTGSIGVSTLKVAAEHSERFQIAGLAAGRSVEALAEQARVFRPEAVALQDPAGGARLERELRGTGIRVLCGAEGVRALAVWPGADGVVVGITGAAALAPTLAAIEEGRTIGLANKETLVMAGEMVTARAKARGAVLLPIDSEHSAVFQCLEGRASRSVQRILLTTSGGPLKDVPLSAFGALTKTQVLDHPRWKMGPKITVDSATMMNKALEVIEARALFGLPVEKIAVVVHPEAIVHSMVEFVDGSVLAQMAVTDMRIPIQYAMTYPDRLPSGLPPLDLVSLKSLHFEAPRPDKFPCLSFGYAAARAGGTAPAVLNAANEACVSAFLSDGLPFERIPRLLEQVLAEHRAAQNPSLEQILQADAWARKAVAARLKSGRAPQGVI